LLFCDILLAEIRV